MGDRPVWASRPTWAGRDSLAHALRNMELFYRILLNGVFSGCFSKITVLLESDEDVFKEFDDLFLWEKIERLLVLWSSDIRHEKRSRIFSLVDLSTPTGCLQLLASYIDQMLSGVSGRNGYSVWEKTPQFFTLSRGLRRN